MRVFNCGTYDLLHPGHLYVLRQARLMSDGGEVVIGLNSDEFVARFKGHPTVQTYLERDAVLSAIVYVDRVVPNTGDEDMRPVVEAVMPDILLVGADWASQDHSRYFHQTKLDQRWLDERGIKLRYMDRLVPGRSSTNLRSIAGSM